jgi:hypothetical protein
MFDVRFVPQFLQKLAMAVLDMLHLGQTRISG